MTRDDGDGLEGGADPDAVRVFAAVAATGSLSRAAEQLGLSQPTVGRKVRALEERVGQPLVARHGRGVALTDAGFELAHAAQEVAAALGRFDLLARAQGREVGGLVRVSASEPVAAELLPGWLAELRASRPRIQVALAADNRVSDVAHREVDVAIRMFRPTTGELVAVRVGESPMGLYASRAYVARRGAPATVAELREHDAIGFDRDPRFVRAFRAVIGDLAAERLVLRTDAHGPALGATRAGIGIGAVQRVIAARYPELVPIEAGVALPSLEVWLVTHRDLRKSRLVRAVFDSLRGWLEATLAAA